MTSELDFQSPKTPSLFWPFFFICCIVAFVSETPEVLFGAYSVITIAVVYGVLSLFDSKLILDKVDKHGNWQKASLTLLLFSLYFASVFGTAFMQVLAWGINTKPIKKK